MQPKVTICIPSFNNDKHIAEAIESALAQVYPHKEILITDDCSTDRTLEIAYKYKVQVSQNYGNYGIGRNLQQGMLRANGKYVIYLCADDIFADTRVVGDVVRIFDSQSEIGVIGRYYYYFMDGYPGAIGTCRDNRILIHSCCPSGMAFRKPHFPIFWTNKIFIEMPNTVAQYLRHYRWTMLEYDTVGARFHPGGNTGTKQSYYTQSPTQNWIDLLGENYQDFPIFITLKNRAPKLLWGEICLHVRNDKGCLLNQKFWGYALVSLLTPTFLLRRFTRFYRHRIARRSAHIIERGENVQPILN